jgi:hypothetical protein
MDAATGNKWFNALPTEDKVTVLLIFMYEITIAMRAVFYDYQDDCETRSRLAYYLSERNHDISQVGISLMDPTSTYWNDGLMEFLRDYSHCPELESYFAHF